MAVVEATTSPPENERRTLDPVPQVDADVPPVAIAGLLLCARPHLTSLGFPAPGATEILAKTGAGRSRAYEIKDALDAQLPSLVRPVGRPAGSAAPVVAESAAASIAAQVRDFLMDHPGCVSGGPKRHHYSADFRCFVLELRAKHAVLELGAFAQAAGVPRPSIEGWLADPEPPMPERRPAWDPDPARGLRVETVLLAWRTWQGSFSAFVEHLRNNLLIPYGHTLIASILAAHGQRRPKRRPGRSPDEKALRGAFDTFFAGAQWEADGTTLGVRINDRVYCFSVELEVDAHSAAVVGASLREAEDSTGVIAAFRDGVLTTGAPPLAQLLDNKPANHCPEVIKALGDTLCIPITPGRPQNDAHVEGAFGLFKSVAPDLVVSALTGRDLAAAIVCLVVTTWARATNHRPRKDRGGRSRVQLYQEKPTAEEVVAAKKALEERLRRQELARKTLEARTNPVLRALLDAAFDKLGLADETGNVRNAIARYPRDAVLAGIATFEGKRKVGTLPESAGARYLLGIVRNITQRDEGLAISVALLRARLDARDAILLGFAVVRDQILEQNAGPASIVDQLVKVALATESRLERIFFLDAAADVIRTQPDPRPIFEHAARRVHTTFRIPHADRLDASRFLADRVVPLA